LDYFENQDLLEVHRYLNELYEAFSGKSIPDDKDNKVPIFQDHLLEVKWVLTRADMPDWDVHWQLFSRARLR
jgi:hypothetical protein